MESLNDSVEFFFFKLFFTELLTNQALDFLCGGHEAGSKLPEEVRGLPG